MKSTRAQMINGKTILITGGTGSFGQAMTQKLLSAYRPKSIRILSRDELKQHEMRTRFNDHPNLRFLIGDVRDQTRLRRAMENVDIVFHAAAMKQVPACEYNPIEAIRTNIDGAINVIEACLDNNIKHVVALSTDKAASPINLYGATKLCSDKLFISANNYAGQRDCRFAVVRYGNVLASRGSVVPVFRELIRNNKPLTITDKRMTRFWITLDQATDFVLDSLYRMSGGELYVPKIPSMYITDLAKLMAPKAKIVVTGIRPGEKLHEYLITQEEGRNTLDLGDRYVVEPEHSWWRRGMIKGKPVAKNFSYDSLSNTQWLSQQAMKKLLDSSHH